MYLIIFCFLVAPWYKEETILSFLSPLLSMNSSNTYKVLIHKKLALPYFFIKSCGNNRIAASTKLNRTQMIVNIFPFLVHIDMVTHWFILLSAQLKTIFLIYSLYLLIYFIFRRPYPSKPQQVCHQHHAKH